MRLPIRPALALVVCAAALAACTAGDTDSLGKEVGDVRAETQRLQKESEKLAAQVAAQTRRIDGLTEDLNHVRSLAMDVKVAPAPKAGAAAAGDGTGDGGTPGASGGLVTTADGSVVTPEVAAVKKYLGTDEGKKLLEAAVVAERDARNREQVKRTVDAMIDRFAKLANLTEDQTKKMKDIMGQAAVARSDMWASMRDLGPDATPEQRDEARQAMVAKTDELKKQTDTQVQAVLSQTQFEQYQQEQDKLRASMRGMGGAGGGAGGTGGRGGRPGGN
jgi:hypothetical protein